LLGLGGSKYRPPPRGVGGGWAGRPGGPGRSPPPPGSVKRSLVEGEVGTVQTSDPFGSLYNYLKLIWEDDVSFRKKCHLYL
jgi:hypothetical protein